LSLHIINICQVEPLFVFVDNLHLIDLLLVYLLHLGQDHIRCFLENNTLNFLTFIVLFENMFRFSPPLFGIQAFYFFLCISFFSIYSLSWSVCSFAVVDLRTRYGGSWCHIFNTDSFMNNLQILLQLPQTSSTSE